MAFGEYGADIVQLEITSVNGPFDSFMRRNFEELRGGERYGRRFGRFGGLSGS